MHGCSASLDQHASPSYRLTSTLLVHAAGKSLPFWFTSQRGGLVPLDAQSGVIFLQEWSDESVWQRPGWNLSAEASLFARVSGMARVSDVTSASGTAKSTSPQAAAPYSSRNTSASIRTLAVHLTAWNFARLSIGRYDETIGIGAPYLTTGQMMMSRNARPAWKISFENPDFFAIPGTRGFLNFKARWSESFLFDKRFVDQPKIHQKYLYINLKPVPELSLMGGIIHNVMWGGNHPELGSLNTMQGYLDSVLGFSEANEATPPGNGIAAYDFGPEYHSKRWSAGAMRLFFLEDLVSTRFRSPWDGMWSGWFHWKDQTNTPWLDYIIYEHINTKKQDARSIDALGAARYYTHDIWRGGWTHDGHLLGNPLLTLDPDRIPEIARPVTNGILVAHHVGLMGNVTEGVRWQMMMTYSRNYGVCEDQFAEVEFCNSKDGSNLRERAYYVPLRELRKDRYSLFGGVMLDSGTLFEERVDERSGGDWKGKGDGKGGGKGAQPVQVQFHIFTGVDWGAFYDEARFGVEFGLTIRY